MAFHVKLKRQNSELRCRGFEILKYGERNGVVIQAYLTGTSSHVRPADQRAINAAFRVRSHCVTEQLINPWRMPPYSRHHKYSKKIERRHRGGKNKNNSRLLLEL